MFIRPVADDDGRVREEREAASDEVDHSFEYKTANELFDLIAKNQNFQPSGDETLTTRDLVLLYKNIDLGTKLMSNANEFKRKTPNQYVETVVYNEDPETDSDLSEIYSSEDLHNVVLINKERIDLLNNPTSLENILCPKFGDLEIQSSDITTEYDRFIFSNGYVNEQLHSLNLMSNTELIGTVLPTSLLDYICCKRLEDNYNFYMDNIIRYVQHTLEHLKRISNGDYLTDKAKEKWREVECTAKNIESENNNKVLEASTSIPLHVERKSSGHASTWDDIVHSEVDVRYLSKILEKKIFFEIPKMICGSYRLFSKCCKDNLIISCKKAKNDDIPDESAEESRVDVVFKLQRSESGHVMSNISSIIILQKAPEPQEIGPVNLLSLPYYENTNTETEYKQLKIKDITSIPGVNEQINSEINDSVTDNKKQYITEIDEEINIDDLNDEEVNIVATDNRNFHCYTNNDNNTNYDQILDCEMNTNDYASEYDSSLAPMSSEPSTTAFIKKHNNYTEDSFSTIPPDELRLTMQRLNIQTALPEESLEDAYMNINNKRKSPQRKRIKSPYENKSYLLEEKKRKRLLEIREMRESEKKKLALNVHCKGNNKYKYGKSAIMPQSSNSVTKLSITNKSFYNSIYGQTLNFNTEHKPSKLIGNKDKMATFIITASDHSDSDGGTQQVTSESNQKHTNKSYNLDDTVTEMMYLQMKQQSGENVFSESTSAFSNDFSDNLKIFSHLISPCSGTDLNKNDTIPLHKKIFEEIGGVADTKDFASSPSNNLITVPVNTPKNGVPTLLEKVEPKKLRVSINSVEFRKSIDKLYDLMNGLGKTKEDDKIDKSKFTASSDKNCVLGDRKSSTIQGSDSGTSIKHHLTSSDPSCLSFANPETSKQNKHYKPKPHQPNVIPKVIISTKSQATKIDTEKVKTNQRKVISPPAKINNPLKAISQLLHDIDNVQKTRHIKTELKLNSGKKQDISTKTAMQQGSNKKRLEQSLKVTTSQVDRYSKASEKRSKLGYISADNPKTSVDERQFSRLPKRQMTDLMDEVKEARGEAVRGPSKFNSRLNSLAQPKKSYVQAHLEERYGKNLVPDGLQRLTAIPNVAEKMQPGSAKRKQKRTNDAVLAIPIKQLLSQPLEKIAKRHIPSSISEAVDATLVNEQSFKKKHFGEKTSNFKKKMGIVQSYMKNNYGRFSPPTDSRHLLLEGQMARVPLVPHDMEQESFTSSPPGEESSLLGKKLHHMVDTLVNNSPPNLTIVVECTDTSSKLSKGPINNLSFLQSKDAKSIDSEDHNEDSINHQSSQYNTVNTFKDEYKSKPDDYMKKCVATPIQTCKSVTELEQLQNALHRRLPISTLQKRLRIKNLTITPKQSMQQVLVLQSGDMGLYLKSSLSQNVILDDSKSEKAENFSNTKLNCNFASIPMQLTTVGFAFPVLHSVQNGIVNNLLHIGTCTEQASLQINTLSCQSAQPICREKSAQADVNEIVTITYQINPVVATANEIGTELSISNEMVGPREAESALREEPPCENKTTVESCNCSMKISDLENVQTDNKEIDNTSSHDIKVNINETYQSSKKKAIVGSCHSNKCDEVISTNTVKHSHDIVDKNEAAIVEACDTNRSEVVDYTSSLDILAGLLSEIQKITTCQTQIANADTDLDNDHQCTELMAVLNNVADLKSIDDQLQKRNREIISIASLDKLRHLESNHSILSYYVSNDGEMTSNDGNNGSNDDAPEKQLIDRFTEIPSQFFPINVSHSTNVSYSFIGVLNQPSNQSIVSFTNNYTDSSLISHKKIIEIPQEHLQVTLETLDGPCAVNEKRYPMTTGKNKPKDAPISIQETAADRSNKSNCSSSEYEAVLKIKRDVLVTVYSILVITVFAALSFPEMLYRS